MALLPYASRVTQTRGPKRDGERGDRGDRGDRDLPAAATTEPHRADATSVDELDTDEVGAEESPARTSSSRRRSSAAEDES